MQSDKDDLIERAIQHFRELAGEEPTEEEIAAIHRAVGKGKDFQGLRYVVAGLLGVRRQKFLYGEDAMKRARGLRGSTPKGSPTVGVFDDTQLNALRETLHAAVDLLCAYLAGPQTA